MDGRAALGLAAYAALVASLATPLYDPLTSGRDDWWALLALVGVVHLGLGVAVGRWWTLALPVVASIAAFLLGGAEGLAWLALFAAMPVLGGLTALGVALRRVPYLAPA